MLPRDARRNGGFTLIELLIVVAIILIISAIAIPSLLRARIAANEASAVEDLRAVTSAATIYSSTWDNGFPPSLSSLGGAGITATCNNALLLDQLMTTPPFQKSGFIFAYTPEGQTAPKGPRCSNPGTYAYLVTAKPSALHFSGQRSFCSDTPGVIHFDLSGTPAASVAACDALPVL